MNLRVAGLCGLLMGSLLSTPGFAASAVSPCKDVAFQSDRFTVCEFSTADADVRLYWGEEDRPYREFGAVSQAAQAEQHRLVFAMNGGMYHKDRSPVGLYVDSDGQRGHLQTKASYGNFGMLPNGVFHISSAGMAVTETMTFKAEQKTPDYATQSGPMLVIDNHLHPKFNAGSTSKRIRNGVGVSGDGQAVYFVMSERPVNFHKFASLFKEELKTPNALYLDGVVSRLFDAASERSDLGAGMGPIIGVVSSSQADINKESEQ